MAPQSSNSTSSTASPLKGPVDTTSLFYFFNCYRNSIHARDIRHQNFAALVALYKPAPANRD